MGVGEGAEGAQLQRHGRLGAGATQEEAAHQLRRPRPGRRRNRGLLHHSPKLGSPTATLCSSVTAAVACCDEVLVRGALLLRTTAPTGAGRTASGCSSTRDTYDNLLCADAEHLGCCTIRFRKDGGVEKLYEMAGDLAAADIHGRAASAGISTGSSARRAHIATPHSVHVLVHHIDDSESTRGASAPGNL